MKIEKEKIMKIEKEKLTGIYFKKKFEAPLSIGNVVENIEEISIFPSKRMDGFIDFKLFEDQNETLITIDYHDCIWKGTLKELIIKLKNKDEKN